jgi:translocation protein SEC63
LIIGWVGVVLLTMQVANAEIKSVTWDPYEILGISEVKTSINLRIYNFMY